MIAQDQHRRAALEIERLDRPIATGRISGSGRLVRRVRGLLIEHRPTIAASRPTWKSPTCRTGSRQVPLRQAATGPEMLRIGHCCTARKTCIDGRSIMLMQY
jgi:hypothetical protein